MNLPKALFVALLFAGLSLPSFAFAATLSMSPAYTSVAKGQTVTVNLLVSSTDQAMNASSGVISFPSDKLQVVSVGKSNSIVSFWIQEPSFSNGAGTVNFEGVIPNPGFTGSAGKILSITFRGVAEGTASVSYSTGSVLANDGQGTELLNGSSGSTITIQAAAPVALSAAPTVVPGAIIVSSPSHPDQTRWYANNSPEFTWTLPTGALEALTILAVDTTSIPNTSYIPAISTKTMSQVSDGTSYFGLRVWTASGWTPTSHFTVNIDTVAPNPFSITVLPYDTKKGVQTQFSTTDALSGIDHYEILVDGVSVVTVEPAEAEGVVSVPTKAVGTHTVTVVAYDKAGNTASASASVTVPPKDYTHLLSTLWTVVNYFSILLLLVGLFFACRYLWRRVRRFLPLFLVEAKCDNRSLYAELIEIHHQLQSEVDHLTREAAARELTSEEKGTLTHLSETAERMHRLMVEEFSREK